MEIESMKSGAAASYQGSAAASTKTLDAAVQPEASTQAGGWQQARKKTHSHVQTGRAVADSR